MRKWQASTAKFIIRKNDHTESLKSLQIAQFNYNKDK